jgi:DNA-binding PucR family transcriptional regulator
VLAGVQGTRLDVVLGGDGTLDRGVRILADAFGAGPVVVGPTVGSLSGAWSSALEALAALRAAPAWPAVPRPVPAAALLPERALNGEPVALQALVDTVFAPLRDAGGSLLETVEAYLDCGGAVEATARALYVHANTVRYRLGRVADLCGLSPNDPRDGYVLRTAITAGRLRPVEGAL